MTGWEPPEDVPELLAVLKAVARGTRRSKLRELEVACARQHRLVEVFKTASGPVVYGWAYPAINGTFADVRREPLAMRLTGGGVHDMVDAQCTCGGAEIPTAWILDKIGRSRRVVWEPQGTVEVRRAPE